jgi:putative addiction module killer protein
LEARERVVEYYLPIGSPAPFGKWRDLIADGKTRAAVLARVARLRSGNFSDFRSVGKGVVESKIDFGPGYRIYYGIDGKNIILLLGGDKSTQDADIETAHGYWADYKERAIQDAKKKTEERRLQGRSLRGPSPKR